MKKILLSLILAASILSGCGEKESSMTCTQSTDNMTTKTTITADKDDKIKELILSITYKGGAKNTMKQQEKYNRKMLRRTSLRIKELNMKWRLMEMTPF